MNLLEQTEAVFPDAVALRRTLHMHPELSEQEVNTEKLIVKTLEELGIPYTAGVAGHGVIAMLGTGKEPCVGIRGDIDALPILEQTGLPYASQNEGVMHACGHDFHTASLLALAKLLKGMESEIPGTVKLFFQPAEETVGGAERMIQAGAMVNPTVSRVLGWHVEPSLPVGAVEVALGVMNATICEFRLDVYGESCHGAHPERGVDAIVAASHVVVALQAISARYFAPTTPVIVTLGKVVGGTKGNIITGQVHFEGTLRALDNKVMVRLKELVTRTCEEVAKAYGARADVQLTDSYPALINDRETSQMVIDTAAELFGADKVGTMDEPSLGGDDFAYFTNAAKGCYFNVGTLAPGQTGQSLHNEKFAPDENAMRTAIALMAATGLKLLNEEK